MSKTPSNTDKEGGITAPLYGADFGEPTIATHTTPKSSDNQNNDGANSKMAAETRISDSRGLGVGTEVLYTPPTDTGAEELLNIHITPTAVDALISRLSGADETMSALIIRLAQTEAQGVVPTCTSLDCPERTGGKCNAPELMAQGVAGEVNKTDDSVDIDPTNVNKAGEFEEVVTELLDRDITADVPPGAIDAVLAAHLADKEKAVREELEWVLNQTVSPAITNRSGHFTYIPVAPIYDRLQAAHQLEEDGKE